MVNEFKTSSCFNLSSFVNQVSLVFLQEICIPMDDRVHQMHCSGGQWLFCVLEVLMMDYVLVHVG
jgi:hypothetical protein